MADSSKAVFLSYASQDAAAARRIAEALRASGVEVWFDQDELVGGDAWDQKIRRQIAACALFVPVISAATQARLEGYFRLEWKLAAQRTHTMADEKAFLLPVVIDPTRHAEAKVPAEFKAVQWTRLPGGEVAAGFIARVAALLSSGVAPASSRPSDEAGTMPALPPNRRRGARRMPGAIGVAVAALALVVAGWVVWSQRKEAGSAAPKSAAPLTEAQKLAAKARQILDGDDELKREKYFLAEDLVKRAIELDPAEPAAWAFQAQMSQLMVYHAIDRSDSRVEAMRRQSERALALAPNSLEVQLASANVRIDLRQDLPGLERELLALAEREPTNWRVRRSLGLLYRYMARPAEAVTTLRRARELSGGSPIADAELVNVLLRTRQYGEAENVLSESLAKRSSGRLFTFDQLIRTQWRGDLASARTALEAWPDWWLAEDRGAIFAWRIWFWSKNYDQAIAAAQRIRRDYINDTYFIGPRAVLTARAHEGAGHVEAARTDWRTVQQLADRELAAAPTDLNASYWKAWALARLGDRAGAEAICAQMQQRRQLSENKDERGIVSRYDAPYFGGAGAAPLWATVGRSDLALAELRAPQGLNDRFAITRAMLELDPAFDPLRNEPEFAAIVAKAPAPEPAVKSAEAPNQVDAKSVAVLAFANLSDDKANEYFSDGISEELLNVLAKVPGLKVAARTSAFYFKGKEVPIPEIAQKLGVAYVVEGSVRKAGNQVRITAQLIKAADGFQVWSETFPRDLKDIFAVQDEIAKNILRAVKGSLMAEAELPHTRTTKIEAYTLFLQGQGAFAKRGDAGLREAIRLFRAALAIDPDYVPALVGLGQASGLLPLYANLNGAKAREMIDGATRAARRVLALDSQNAGAYAILGWVMLQFELRWTEGLAAVLRARELAPNDSWIWNTLGDYYRYVGDLPQALAAKQRAWELDPLSAVSHWDIAYVHVVAGNYDQAIRWSEKTVALAPHNLDSYTPGILAAGKAGRLDVMRRTLVAARQNVRENEGMLFLLEALAAIYEKKSDEARALLSKVAPLVESGDGSPAYLGYCYLLLGESERAAFWLQRALELRDPAIVWNEQVDFNVIAANPATRPILDQPGLKELFEMRQRNARGIVPNR